MVLLSVLPPINSKINLLKRKAPKKILLSAISALLIATTVFGSATFASEEIPEGSSLESIRKFNEYIASLPEENAQLILEDQEMVANMKLDSYWAEPDENAVSTQGLVRVFPLDQYPAGSYFTVKPALAILFPATHVYIKQAIQLPTALMRQKVPTEIAKRMKELPLSSAKPSLIISIISAPCMILAMLIQ